MAIEAAIFDCDGTLLDSMPMWTEQCVALLTRYGVKDSERIFAEHESLDMDKKCYWYHDNLGIGESGEALYQELWGMVEQAYRKDVKPYAGCYTFLNELRKHGVPCVTLSSTPTALLERALKDHGLLEYFSDLVFVGDVGRGKQYSDCYIAVAERLGTAPENTWVFEDAPFGIRSAVRAGLPTVAIVNDHDNRDVAFIDRWATLVVHSYDELSVAILDKLAPRLFKAAIVAGSPNVSSRRLVKAVARDSNVVLVADRGVDALMGAGVVPNYYCGDKDSASEDAIAWAQLHGTVFENHPREKDDTDLGLAFALVRKLAEERGACAQVTLTCASGGRPDHALGVFGVLSRNCDLFPVMVEDGFVCHILSPQGKRTWRSDADIGATVSVIALTSDTEVSEAGMRWNLESAALEVLSDLGVSNRLLSKDAAVTCESGVAAVFVIRP